MGCQAAKDCSAPIRASPLASILSVLDRKPNDCIYFLDLLGKTTETVYSAFFKYNAQASYYTPVASSNNQRDLITGVIGVYPMIQCLKTSQCIRKATSGNDCDPLLDIYRAQATLHCFACHIYTKRIFNNHNAGRIKVNSAKQKVLLLSPGLMFYCSFIPARNDA